MIEQLQIVDKRWYLGLEVGRWARNISLFTRTSMLRNISVIIRTRNLSEDRNEGHGVHTVLVALGISSCYYGS
jgi:hypothetical protein